MKTFIAEFIDTVKAAAAALVKRAKDLVRKLAS